jgi:hypothetical protein
MSEKIRSRFCDKIMTKSDNFCCSFISHKNAKTTITMVNNNILLSTTGATVVI